MTSLCLRRDIYGLIAVVRPGCMGIGRLFSARVQGQRSQLADSRVEDYANIAITG